MSKTIIYHNPRCSKSRESLALLEDKGEELEIIKYLENTPSKDELKNLLKMLKMDSAQDLMRKKEDIYKELNLKDETNEDKLLDAMVQNPKLIERPIVVKNNKAVIGRPPSLVVEL